MLMAPLALSGQEGVILTELIEIDENDWLITTVWLALQLRASFTVTVYDPAGTPLMPDVLEPLLHR